MSDRPGKPEGKVITLPLVPLRDIVVFPHTMVPFVVGRKPSLLAVEQALAGASEIMVGVQARQLCAVPLHETWKDHKPLDEYQVKVQRLLA